MNRDGGNRSNALAVSMITAGAVLVTAGWFLPVNLTSVSISLLRAAGKGTPTLGAFGRDLVDFEKPGPAELVSKAADELDDPRAPALTEAINEEKGRQPEFFPWGGWDPFLQPLVGESVPKPDAEADVPVMSFFLPEKSRDAVRSYLAGTRSSAVQDILASRDVKDTGRFQPATQPGGQPLDAVILMTALLAQADHFPAPLLRDVRDLARTAVAQNQLGDLEPFYLDMLSLGQRLDWIQLSELLAHSTSVSTINEFAYLSRAAPDRLAIIYSAALLSDSADGVAGYLLRYGRPGLDDLSQALSEGQGALKLLVARQVPVGSGPTPDLGAAATFAYLHPKLALGLKWFAFLVGAWLLLHGFDRILFIPIAGLGRGLPHVQGGVIAILLAGLLVLVTEPYLLKAAPPSEFQLHVTFPALVAASDSPAAASPLSTTTTMDTSTLLSIALFACLQVVMYLVCLLKIREIERSSLTPAIKLRLMENEENLFDGGLYLGIAGTATALVLQVLRIIEPNLLAAYSSNLFGIACVALVKIRHVRPYKRGLILRGLRESTVAP